MKALQGIFLFLLSCVVVLLVCVNWTDITDKLIPQQEIVQEEQQEQQEDTGEIELPDETETENK